MFNVLKESQAYNFIVKCVYILKHCSDDPMAYIYIISYTTIPNNMLFVFVHRKPQLDYCSWLSDGSDVWLRFRPFLNTIR